MLLLRQTGSQNDESTQPAFAGKLASNHKTRNTTLNFEPSTLNLQPSTFNFQTHHFHFFAGKAERRFLTNKAVSYFAAQNDESTQLIKNL